LVLESPVEFVVGTMSGDLLLPQLFLALLIKGFPGDLCLT
jgi:hypothetical protein